MVSCDRKVEELKKPYLRKTTSRLPGDSENRKPGKIDSSKESNGGAQAAERKFPMMFIRVKWLLWLSPLGALVCFSDGLTGAGIFWLIVAVLFYGYKFGTRNAHA